MAMRIYDVPLITLFRGDIEGKPKISHYIFT